MRYYAPFKADGINLNTLRTHEALAANTEPLVWGLREVLDYAEVVLNRDDVDAKADAFIDFLADRVVGREYQDDMLRGRPFLVQSFADLEEFFRAIFDFMEALGRGGEVWKTHHVATIRKVRNRLGNISTRSKGLVTDDGVANDLPWGQFTDRSMHVVDVAGLDPLAQDLVFARVVSKLREHLERRDLGVDHVVVFVDELNKYAPADGPDTYVRKMLLDLSERGRYLGLVLFSAQQFRSQVQRRVVGNAGTALFGRMDMDELATPAYQTVSPATKIKLATLPKGELMVRHPHFTQPIFVEVSPAAGAERARGDRAVPSRGRRPSPGRGRPTASPAGSRGLYGSGARRGGRPSGGRRPPGARRDPPGAPGRSAARTFWPVSVGGWGASWSGAAGNSGGEAGGRRLRRLRRSRRVAEDPPQLHPQKPSAAGEPAVFPLLFFIEQRSPRGGDTAPAQLPHEVGARPWCS